MLFNIGDIVLYKNRIITDDNEVECEIVALKESFCKDGTVFQDRAVLAPIGSNKGKRYTHKKILPDEVQLIRSYWQKFSSKLDARKVLCYNSGNPTLVLWPSQFNAPFAAKPDGEFRLKDGEEDHGGLRYL